MRRIFLRIIFIVMAIGLLLTACDDDDDNNKNNSGNTNNNGNNSTSNTFIVTNRAEWEDAFYKIRLSGSGESEDNRKEYTIIINGNLTGTDGVYNQLTNYANLTNVTITLKGNGTIGLYDDGISTTGQGYLIYLRNGKLIIDSQDLVIKGRNENTAEIINLDHDADLELRNGEISGNIRSGDMDIAAVRVSKGTFTMTGGKITNNTSNGVISGGTFNMKGGEISNNSGFAGGGVGVGGIFIMEGGKISGNTNESGYGGGVGVGGTFIMKGGEISGNISKGLGGGGVYIHNNATFTMEGGIISGNTANISATYLWYGSAGGGVFINRNGIFNKTGGIIYGKNEGDNSNLAYSNTRGHAVYFYMYDSPVSRLYRDTTLGISDNISTSDISSTAWGQ